MSVTKNISCALRRYKEINNLSINDFAEELGIAVSSLQGYLNGEANPTALTIELLAEKTGIPVRELISGPAPARAWAQAFIRTSWECRCLTPAQRDEAARHLLAIAALFGESALED